MGCGSEETVNWFLDESKITVKVSPCIDDSIDDPGDDVPSIYCKALDPNFRCVPPPEIQDLPEGDGDGDSGFPMMKSASAIGGSGGAPARYAVAYKGGSAIGGSGGAPMRAYSVDGSDDCFVYEIEALKGATNPNAPVYVELDSSAIVMADNNGSFKMTLEAYGQYDGVNISVIDLETGMKLNSITKVY